jgi:chromosome segregation ATPase
MENWIAGGAGFAILSAIVELIKGWWHSRAQKDKTEVKEKEITVKEKDATTKALDTAMTSLEMALKSITVLQGQVAEFNTRCINQDNVIEQLRDDQTLHEKKCKTAIDQMSTELVKLRGEHATAQARVKKLEDEQRELRGQLVTANEEIEKLKTENAHKDAKIEQLRNRIATLETKLAASEAAREKAERERDALAKRIEKLNGQTQENKETKPNED